MMGRSGRSAPCTVRSPSSRSASWSGETRLRANVARFDDRPTPFAAGTGASPSMSTKRDCLSIRAMMSRGDEWTLCGRSDGSTERTPLSGATATTHRDFLAFLIQGARGCYRLVRDRHHTVVGRPRRRPVLMRVVGGLLQSEGTASARYRLAAGASVSAALALLAGAFDRRGKECGLLACAGIVRRGMSNGRGRFSAHLTALSARHIARPVPSFPQQPYQVGQPGIVHRIQSWPVGAADEIVFTCIQQAGFTASRNRHSSSTCYGLCCGNTHRRRNVARRNAIRSTCCAISPRHRRRFGINKPLSSVASAAGKHTLPFSFSYDPTDRRKLEKAHEEGPRPTRGWWRRCEVRARVTSTQGQKGQL